MKVLITGSGGLIGSHLTTFLADKDHAVNHLTRSKYQHLQATVFEWDPARNQADAGAFEGVDAIVNLAGAGVADGRWTKARKELILGSRTGSLRVLYDQVSQMEVKPKVLISASGTGYYGALPFDKLSKEEDAPGANFLAGVCRAWEAEAMRFEELGVRVVVMRIGVVLDEMDGALPRLVMPVRMYIGAPLGTGSQIISWVHIRDVCRFVHFALEHQGLSGRYNLVADNPLTNSAFTRLIGQVIHRPVWLPNVPAFALKLALGEMSEIVLEGNMVSNQKLRDAGFEFHYKTAQDALTDILTGD